MCVKGRNQGPDQLGPGVDELGHDATGAGVPLIQGEHLLAGKMTL